MLFRSINTSNGVYIGTDNGTTTTTVVPFQIGAYPAGPAYTSSPDHAIVLDGWSGSTVYHNAIVNRKGRDLSFHTAITGNGFSDTNERARIDSSGRLLVGTSSTSAPALLNIQGYSGSNTGEGIIYLQKGSTSPANGDTIGNITFADSNSNRCAQIYSQRDGGTWTSGTSQPGRLVFSTTADGASSPTERMRISNNGAVKISKIGRAHV